MTAVAPSLATGPIPLRERGPVGTTFRAIGTTIHLLATDPAALADASTMAHEHLDALDRAVSRFRPDSEVSRLASAAENGPASALLSPVFASSLRAALRAARLTDGLVDPTVGRAVEESGYDADLDAVRRRPALAASAGGSAEVPGWRQITLDPATDRVEVPRGCLLDLGATAKAHAADVLAARLADRLPGGFLVNLGGDIALAGPPPVAGWQVGVEDADGSVLQVLSLVPGQAVTTSSTRLRTWSLDDGGTRHHILDPRTGETATATWAQVTCVAASALEANAASTAAVVLGDEAPAWLEAHGIPSRLDAADGQVVTTSGWPVPEEADPR